MIVVGIDAGQRSSGVVIVDFSTMDLLFASHRDNGLLLEDLRTGLQKVKFYRSSREEVMSNGGPFVIIEKLVSYYKPVGNDTFETIEWNGRFREAVESRSQVYLGFKEISRPDIKMVLFGSTTFRGETGARKAISSSMIKGVICDRFPQSGGGKNKSVGTSKEPGKLFMMPSTKNGGDHCWSALAIAVSAYETM